MRNTNKKGFTIVELVIVVAVIAILAAVLIPTFSGIIRKANVSNDTQLIKNLNTALAADVDGDKTMAGALAAAAEFGYDIGKINAKATGNEILWDSVNNVFCYLKDNAIEYIPEFPGAKETSDADYWVIDDAVSTVYSTYLINYEGESVEAKHSLDVTACGAIDVTYAGSAAVSIYTNGGSLTVNSGAVTHYGVGYILTVAESAKSAYVEKGSFAANAENIENVGVGNSEYTYVATADQLAAALAEGKEKIALSNNISIESTIGIDGNSYDFTVITDSEINMNGYNINAVHNVPSSYTGNNFGVIQIKGCNVVFCGAGEITLEVAGNNMGWNAGSKVIELQGNANVTLESGVLVEHLGGTDMAYGVDMLNSNGAATLNIDGAMVKSTYTGVRLFNNNKTSTINLNSGVVEASNRDIWVHNPSAAAVDANGVVNIAESYTFTIEVQTSSYNGRKYFID